MCKTCSIGRAFASFEWMDVSQSSGQTQSGKPSRTIWDMTENIKKIGSFGGILQV